MTAVLSEAPTSSTTAARHPRQQQNNTHPIRICFLIDQLRTGGTESQLIKLIEGLDRSQFQPYLCLLDGRDPTSQSLESTCCPTKRLGIRVLAQPATGMACVRFARQLSKWRIDILQVFFPDSTYVGVLAGRLAGVPHIIRTRRDLFYWVTPAHRRWGKYLDGFYNRFFVDALITNCQACRDAAAESERPPARHIAVLENGIELERFASVRPLATQNGPTLRIGAVGMLRPEKRLDLLIEATAILRNRGIDVCVTIAGEGPERARLEDLIAKRGLQDCVMLRGLTQDIPGFLSQVDIAVLCSDTEGLSNALLEYMAAGRAVVATSVGGNVEVIEEGRTGLLVPPGDAHSLAAAIQKLVESPSLCRELGAAARATVNADFSNSAMVRRHEDFYQTLMKKAGRRTRRRRGTGRQRGSNGELQNAE